MIAETVQIQIVQTLGPILVIVITHFLSNRKLDHITELSNSMLSSTIAKKEEADRKVEELKANDLLVAKTRIAELEKQVALITTPVVVAPPVVVPENLSKKGE